MRRWPKGPRFTAGSVTGAYINGANPPVGGGTNSRQFPTLWYVHDRAHCCRVVAEGGMGAKGERCVRALARQLNKWDRQ